MESKYRLSNTGANSNKYGVCEVCGKQCSEVWYQVQVKNSANSHFGHKECLISKQK